MTNEYAALPNIGFAMDIGSHHGWGIHAYNLAKRLLERKLAKPVAWLGLDLTEAHSGSLPFPIVTGSAFGADYRSINGLTNHPAGLAEAYGFLPTQRDKAIHVFETTCFTERDFNYMNKFGKIIACSAWNAEVLTSIGGTTVEYAPVGVDSNIFCPKNVLPSNVFTVFSGGKLEYRKGQDIVLAAFRIFNAKFPDSKLITMWQNRWPDTAMDIVLSPHSMAKPPVEKGGGPHKLDIHRWVVEAGIPDRAHEDIGAVSDTALATVLQIVDLAVFPNRCEGGTNMVAMECISAGVPTVLSDNSGHKDLIRALGDDVMTLEAKERSRGITSAGSKGYEYWKEVSVDELVALLTLRYHAARKHNKSAHITMVSDYSWTRCMDRQIHLLELDKPEPALLASDEVAPWTPPPPARDTVVALAKPESGELTAEEQHAFKLCQHARNLRDAAMMVGAELAARRALMLAPLNYRVVTDVGSILLSVQKPFEAKQLVERALKMNPRAEHRPGMTHVLGLAKYYCGEYDSALGTLNGVFGYHDADWDRAHLLMLTGDWKRGWEAMEVRSVRTPDQFPKRTMPTWEGQDFHGKTLWVEAEQGLGDTMQLARYISWAASRGGRVIFSVWKEVLQLFYGYPGVDEARMLQWDVPEPDADYHVRLLSLPRLHGTTPDNVPPDPKWFVHLGKNMDTSLRGPTDRTVLKVGLCWGGSVQHQRDSERSIRLEKLVPLLGLPHVQMYSFQVGPKVQELTDLGVGAVLVDFHEKLTTWVVTASALLQLDLLITVDTAVAHMAGALGVPTWLLLCKTPDWRWLLKRDDTPWYPSMRLFRQKKLGDWDELVGRVVHELNKPVERARAHVRRSLNKRDNAPTS